MLWTTQGGIYCRPGFLRHEELAPVYAAADVHVSCSQFETLGNTVLEAHACSTTVVLPRTQGFVDTVNHQVLPCCVLCVAIASIMNASLRLKVYMGVSAGVNRGVFLSFVYMII